MFFFWENPHSVKQKNKILSLSFDRVPVRAAIKSYGIKYAVEVGWDSFTYQWEDL